MPEAPVTIILLAGQRAGVVNPLAARAGVSHKCLVPIRGRPLIAHVLDTATALPDVREVRISLEPAAHAEVARIAAEFAGRGVPVTFVANARNIVDSVHAAAGGDPGPFLITTADNVLLTPAGIGQVRERLALFDGVLGIVRPSVRHGRSGNSRHGVSRPLLFTAPNGPAPPPVPTGAALRA